MRDDDRLRCGECAGTGWIEAVTVEHIQVTAISGGSFARRRLLPCAHCIGQGSREVKS